MGRVLAVGDIHGGHKALVQCLERSGFDKENDTLIQLGDICDGWDEVYECVEELLSCKNLIPIKGNHDQWFNEYCTFGLHPVRWLQGAEATAQSYANHAGRPIHILPDLGGYKVDLTNYDIPKTHIEFFSKQVLYYIDWNMRIYTHGGFNRKDFANNLKRTNPSDFYWNRTLWNQALSCKSGKLITEDNFNEIFIGHTATTSWGTDKPMNSGGVWNLDTGAGFQGKLTIMDVSTKEYWQSDNVQELYPGKKGR